MVSFGALARRACLDELRNVGGEAWPPYRAAGQREGFVAAKVATQRRRMEFTVLAGPAGDNHLRGVRTSGHLASFGRAVK